MEWTDDAIVLSSRPYADSAALASLLTREHGRHAGLVHGGRSSRIRPVVEPGTMVRATWKARLADQLGHYSLEPVRSGAALLLDDPLRLAALVAACALVDAVLPEREPHASLYEGMVALLDSFESPFWAEVYVRWEVGLLEVGGFGLDLTRCAATGLEAQGTQGANDYLAYVSPRTGRAVSLTAGEPFRDKLLRLPSFLLGQSAGGPEEVQAGLALTGHFLERHLFAQRHAEIPPARTRFVERYTRFHTRSGTTPA